MPRDDDAGTVTVGSAEGGSATVRAATVRAATVRYWAGARAAAGAETDLVRDCATVAEAVAAVDALHPGLAAVTAVSTLLLDGRAAHRDDPLPDGSVLEVLPPFAGG
jgi:molybdopterin converting factor small subunit